MGSLRSSLFSAPLLWALLAPTVAVLVHRRVRVVIAVVLIPLALVLLATLISTPTDWGHAKDPGSDDVTITGALTYLLLFTLIAEAVGGVLAAIVGGGLRHIRSRAARGQAS